jgi:hypothetical protein
MQTRLMLVVAALCAALVMPTEGSASEPEPTYAVSACSVGAESVPIEGWTPSTTGSLVAIAIDECATNHQFGFTVYPAQGGLGRWTFHAPPGTVLRTTNVYGRVGSGDPNATLIAWAGNVRYEGPWWTNGQQDDPTQALGVPGLDSQAAGLEFSCSQGCSQPASLRISRVDSILLDRNAPTAQFNASEQSLRFADVGGGVESVELEIDGQTTTRVFVGGARCHRPYVNLVPCASEGVISLLDQGLRPGERSVFATLYDVAGNKAYAGPYVMRVPEPPRAPAPIPPRDGSVILDGADTRRVAYTAVAITGVVRDLEGFPIPGAAVVAATQARGQEWRAGGQVQADATGRFAVRLPKGPTRAVRLSYGSAGSTLLLQVAAPIRLSSNRRTTRNGRAITFTGRIPESGASDTRVTLQAWANGKWMPFRTVQLRKGKFSARYRFSGTFRTQRYRFRAVVGNDPDFVFAAGRSRAVSVVVRGRSAR